MKTEIWKNVVGYEGLYQVSSFGRVKSLDRNKWHGSGWYILKGRVLKSCNSSNGYLLVGLYKKSRITGKRVHQLVAESFKNHKPNGHKIVINHIDFNRENNHVSNLEIVTSRVNGDQKHLRSSSKHTGVCCVEVQKKWVSQIRVNGKIIYLGRFDNEKEASEYYENALAAIKNNKEIKIKKRKQSSSYKGVILHKRSGKWIARIKINKKTKHIGYFKNELDAYNARFEYENKHTK